jgi:hypothetical protein
VSLSNGEKLLTGLPFWLNTAENSTNRDLMLAFGESFDRLDADLDTVDSESTVQHADTLAALEKLAELVDVNHRANESKETYRIRVISAYQALTSEGTKNDILTSAATLLNVDESTLTIEDTSEAGVLNLSIPESALDTLAVSETDFIESLENQLAASYRITSTVVGTLKYISEADYLAGTYDTTKGYDHLDVGGDPTGEGGTYSRLLSD